MSLYDPVPQTDNSPGSINVYQDILKNQKTQADIANTQATTQSTLATADATRASAQSTLATAAKTRSDTVAVDLANQLTQGKIASAQNAIETDSQGNPIIDPSTGVAKINVPKYKYNLFATGNGDEAIKLATTINSNQQGEIANTQAGFNASTNIRNTIALAAKAAYDTTNGTPAQKQAAEQQTWEHMSQIAIQGSQNKPGVQPIDPSQLTYVPGLAASLSEAQILPGNQQALKQAQENINISNGQLKLATDQFNNSQLTNFTDPVSQDPNSPASATARAAIKNALGTDLPDNISATQIYNNPLYKSALDSTGAAVGVLRSGAATEVNKWASVQDAISAARTKLPAGLSPANFVQNWLQGKVASTPELANLYAQLSKIDPAVLNSTQSFGALSTTANAMKAQADANYKSVGGNAPTQTSPTDQIRKAPQEAIDRLKAHPELSADFKSKYGYLPK